MEEFRKQKELFLQLAEDAHQALEDNRELAKSDHKRWTKLRRVYATGSTEFVLHKDRESPYYGMPLFFRALLVSTESAMEILEALADTLPELMLLSREMDNTNPLGALMRYMAAAGNRVMKERATLIAPRMIVLLKEHNLFVDSICNSNRKTAALWASNDPDVLVFLMNQVDDVDIPCALSLPDRGTVLGTAISSGKVNSAVEILRRLDTNNSGHVGFLCTTDLSIHDYTYVLDQATYLHMLSDTTIEVATKLVEMLDDNMFASLIAHRDSVGETPLHRAVRKSNPDTFELLVRRTFLLDGATIRTSVLPSLMPVGDEEDAFGLMEVIVAKHTRADFLRILQDAGWMTNQLALDTPLFREHLVPGFTGVPLTVRQYLSSVPELAVFLESTGRLVKRAM